MALRLPKMIEAINHPKKRILLISGGLTFLAIAGSSVTFYNGRIEKDVYMEDENSDMLEVDLDNTFLETEDETWDENNKPMKENKHIEGKKHIENISFLKPYPSTIQSRSEDLANLRNPFTAPSALSSAQGIPAPLISIKGFAANMEDPKAFLNINNSEDYEYRIGQDVGNGYIIVEIEPESRKISVSDGVNQFSYILKEF